jgi:hypothetical protein
VQIETLEISFDSLQMRSETVLDEATFMSEPTIDRAEFIGFKGPNVAFTFHANFRRSPGHGRLRSSLSWSCASKGLRSLRERRGSGWLPVQQQSDAAMAATASMRAENRLGYFAAHAILMLMPHARMTRLVARCSFGCLSK